MLLLGILDSSAKFIYEQELIIHRQCNKLDHETQLTRIGGVHCLLQDSLKQAEKQGSQPQLVEERIRMQTATLDLILQTLNKDLVNM